MPGWALKREIFPQENGPLGWGLPAPVVGVSVFGLAAVERPNQIELLGFDIREAIKAGAARSDFFAGVGVGLNARLAIKALVIGRDFFAKAGVVLLHRIASRMLISLEGVAVSRSDTPAQRASEHCPNITHGVSL